MAILRIRIERKELGYPPVPGTTSATARTSKAHWPGPGIYAIPESIMSPSTSHLLTSVCEAVRDLEEMYGPTDQGVVHAKQILVACLESVHLIETPEEARLFNIAQELVNR